MSRRRLVLWLFPVALLLAQAGGITHRATHAGSDAPAKDRLAIGAVCDDCVSFAKLTHLATDGLSLTLGPAEAIADFRVAYYRFVARAALPYRSRGPPVLL